MEKNYERIGGVKDGAGCDRVGRGCGELCCDAVLNRRCVTGWVYCETDLSHQAIVVRKQL